MKDFQLVLVVARARNGVIGLQNKMPWYLPADFAHFKKTTLGKPIVMGRKTFESIGRPLPGRTNIVVTRNQGWQAEGILVTHSLQQALAVAGAEAKREGVHEVMLIGGASLYEQALPLADKVVLTEVHAEVEGDAYFPDLFAQGWVEQTRTFYQADANNVYDFAVLELVRRQN